MRVFASCQETVRQTLFDAFGTEKGIALAFCASGDQLISEIRSNHDAAVIIDADQGLLESCALVRRIRWELQLPHTEIPVLVIGSRLTKEAKTLLRASGAAFYLDKPMAAADVASMMNLMTDRKMSVVRSLRALAKLRLFRPADLRIAAKKRLATAPKTARRAKQKAA